MADKNKKRSIASILSRKTGVRQMALNNTAGAFGIIKNIISGVEQDYFGTDIPHLCKIELKQLSNTDLQLRIGDDMLIFTMLPMTFMFDRDHIIWKMPYCKENPDRACCGMINIYNFLADSIQYRREEDIGYLIARIFVNMENHFFVEGKRQTNFWVNQFGTGIADNTSMDGVIFSAMQYVADFDPLTPPYDDMKITNTGLLFQKIENSRLKTGKRMGFSFNSDDVTP